MSKTTRKTDSALGQAADFARTLPAPRVRRAWQKEIVRSARKLPQRKPRMLWENWGQVIWSQLLAKPGYLTLALLCAVSLFYEGVLKEKAPAPSFVFHPSSTTPIAQLDEAAIGLVAYDDYLLGEASSPWDSELLAEALSLD